MRRTYLVCVLLFGSNCDGTSGPNPNPAITATTTTAGPFQNTNQVTCTGPADQLAMLSHLCGYAGVSDPPHAWTRMGNDEAVALGLPSSPQLLIYGDSTSRLAIFVNLHPSAAPVNDWSSSEAVTSGSAQVFPVTFDPCSGTFSGSAMLAWRATTIHVIWSALPPGC